jgi:hypothetical protein
MSRRPADPEPGLLGYPISLRVHVALLALFAVLGLAVTIDIRNEKPVDQGFWMVGDLKAMALWLCWGTFGAYFLTTTLLVLTRRATVVTYGLALLLSPWTLMVVLIALQQLQRLVH